MNQEEPFVVIRVYQPSDQLECYKLIMEGVMSTVRPSFFSALTREVTFQMMITMAAIMFVFIGLSPTICILSVPGTIVFIYLCVYFSHLKKATNLSNEAANIEKNFLSSKYTCEGLLLNPNDVLSYFDLNYLRKFNAVGFWVAEVYEPPSLMRILPVGKYTIIHEDQLDSKLQEDRIFSKKIIGIVGVNRCDVMYESAWLRRMTIHHKYQRKGIGTALLNKAIDFCQSRGYESIELVTSECQDGARTLYLQKGFKLRQLYHKSILGTLVQVLMYQFTLAINQTDEFEKKMD